MIILCIFLAQQELIFIELLLKGSSKYGTDFVKCAFTNSTNILAKFTLHINNVSHIIFLKISNASFYVLFTI